MKAEDVKLLGAGISPKQWPKKTSGRKRKKTKCLTQRNAWAEQTHYKRSVRHWRNYS